MYKIEGGKVYSDKGKLVASLTQQGSVEFEPGMAPAHKRGFQEWLRENGATFGNLPEPADSPVVPEAPPSLGQKVEDKNPADSEPEKETSLADLENEAEKEMISPKPPPAPQSVVSLKRLAIADIPDDRLPPFDPRLGVSTPGFQEFVKRNNLDREQTVSLIRRLERK